MLFHRYRTINKIFWLLIVLLAFLSEDCAGWLDESKSIEALVPGGLNTDNNAAKKDFKAGWQAMQLGKLDEAIFFFQLALNKDPEFPQAYYTLGKVYFKENRFQEAIAFFELAESTGQSNKIFLAEITRIKLETLQHMYRLYEQNAVQALNENRWGEAIILLRNALSIKPGHMDLQLMLAGALYQHNDYGESMKAYQSILDSDSSSIEALDGLLRCMVATGDYESARKIVDGLNIDDINDAELVELCRYINNQYLILSMPQEYRDTIQKDAVTRGDLAALFITTFGRDLINVVSKPSAHSGNVFDIAGHWAKPYIVMLVSRNIMNTYENEMFRPDKPVSRNELAELLCKILPEFQTDTLPVNAVSDIHDVPSLNPSYECIQYIVGNNIMKLSDDQCFHLNSPVTGTETQAILDAAKYFLETGITREEEPAINE